MTEKSIMWTTGSTGDGASEYTQAEVIRWLRQSFISDNTDEGVLKNYLNELEVTGTATPVSVNTGGAYVYGFPYWNTASVDVAIPTPSAQTRVDYIVLRAGWSAQTVRITRIAGTEGAGAPSLTQSDGVTWDIPLATASITTGGVITCSDARVFLHPNVEIEAGMFASGAVVAADIANRARSLWVQPEYVYNDTDTAEIIHSASRNGYAMPDEKQCQAYGRFAVPEDFASGMTARAVMYPNANGTLVYNHVIDYGANGEAPNTHNDAAGLGSTEAVTNNLEEAASLAVSAAAVGDFVYVNFVRQGNHASDTIGDTVYFLGWLIDYTADS